MDFLKKLDLSPSKVLKVVGVTVVGLFILMFLASFLRNSFGGMSFGGVGQGGSYSVDSYSESGGKYFDNGMMKLSIRNVASTPPRAPGTTGNTAEDFEVKDYNVSIETGDRDYTCGVVSALKLQKYVIFENASESDTYCNFSFKVETSRVSEITAVLKDLNPKDFSENIYTIKNQVDDFTSEIEILSKKRVSIEDTLKNALVAYDVIANLATKSQDAATLAKVIDSKIQTIERLTQERININEQLDRMSRMKTEQLDRLQYTYFNVNVYENKYVDLSNIKESWKQAIKNMVFSINGAVQNATVNLVGFMISLIPLFVYAIIIILIAKYGWRFTKAIWSK